MESRQFLLGTVACQTVCPVVANHISMATSLCISDDLCWNLASSLHLIALPFLSSLTRFLLHVFLLFSPFLAAGKAPVPRRGTAGSLGMASFWMPGRWPNQFTYINQRVPLAPVVQLKLWCSSVYGFSRMLPPQEVCDIRAGKRNVCGSISS